jgi:hypothetical protein
MDIENVEDGTAGGIRRGLEEEFTLLYPSLLTLVHNELLQLLLVPL